MPCARRWRLSRLPEFFQDIQDAFSQVGDDDSVFPIQHFYQRWGTTIAIERAVIRTANFARTLYTICTFTLPYIDPQ